MKDFMIQGGDVLNENGTGSISIYGSEFNDENFKYDHNKPGMISMANRGENSNGSQFFINTVPTKWLNNKHVVFGRVIKNTFKYVEAISNIKVKNGSVPIRNVVIKDCGEYIEKEEKKDVEREL